MKVYVVAWEYIGGGGFDWYYTKESALTEFNAEKEICKEFKEDEWTAAYFEYQSSANEVDDITDEIDANLCFLFDDAKLKYREVK